MRRSRSAWLPSPSSTRISELLADDIISNGQRGYKTYILSENRAQLERLENIFYQSGRKEAQINPLPITLHEGFIDHDLKLCFYTDHQIFDRYQRYRINGEIRRDEQMTVAELNQLRMGDYVVHIDHGVGAFRRSGQDQRERQGTRGHQVDLQR